MVSTKPDTSVSWSTPVKLELIGSSIISIDSKGPMVGGAPLKNTDKTFWKFSLRSQPPSTTPVPHGCKKEIQIQHK